MHDDGTHGDQEAGDGVWSYASRFAPGTWVFYAYTNGGEPGRWQGMEVPEVRRFTVEATWQGGYRPVDSFGSIYL